MCRSDASVSRPDWCLLFNARLFCGIKFCDFPQCTGLTSTHVRCWCKAWPTSAGAAKREGEQSIFDGIIDGCSIGHRQRRGPHPDYWWAGVTTICCYDHQTHGALWCQGIAASELQHIKQIIVSLMLFTVSTFSRLLSMLGQCPSPNSSHSHSLGKIVQSCSAYPNCMTSELEVFLTV